MRLLDTPMGTAPRPGRQWLRWLGLAACVTALAVAFVNLGQWQLDRLDERRARNDSVLSHENAVPVPFEAAFGRTIGESDQWQKVSVQGTFDPDHQFLVRYRRNAGQGGYELITPLRTTTGAWVLVDRGFAVRPSAEDYPTALPAPPAGEVSIVGYVRRDEQGAPEAVTPNPPANSVRLVNSAALAAALPYPVVNGYLSVLTITPAQDDGLVPVQPPELTEGNHLSYAVQWFAFAGIAGIGLVLLIRSDVRALRHRAAPAAPERREDG